jgi:hypothetical protein
MEAGGTKIFRNVTYTHQEEFLCHVAIRRLHVGEASDPEDDTWYVATDADDIAIALTWYGERFQIEEMFRDLKDRLNMDRHQLGTEESVGKMMLIIALAYRIVLEDGTQWLSKIGIDRIQKPTSRGTLSVWGKAKACFEAALPEAPPEVGNLIVGHWTNRRAA